MGGWAWGGTVGMNLALGLLKLEQKGLSMVSKGCQFSLVLKKKIFIEHQLHSVIPCVLKVDSHKRQLYLFLTFPSTLI